MEGSVPIIEAARAQAEDEARRAAERPTRWHREAPRPARALLEKLTSFEQAVLGKDDIERKLFDNAIVARYVEEAARSGIPPRDALDLIHQHRWRVREARGPTPSSGGRLGFTLPPLPPSAAPAPPGPPPRLEASLDLPAVDAALDAAVARLLAQGPVAVAPLELDEGEGEGSPCVCLADGDIPAPLIEYLSAALSALHGENPAGVDPHPSIKPRPDRAPPVATVLDHVHPSLHPLVYGETLLSDGSVAAKPSKPAPRALWETGFFAERHARFSHQWLPAEVQASGGDALRLRFCSYVNNLPTDTHGDVYRAIARVARVVVPCLAAAMSGDTRALLDRRLKLIVKASTYELRAGEAYSGSWHSEGVPQERIAASAIVYLRNDADVVDAGLEFRHMMSEQQEESLIMETPQLGSGFSPYETRVPRADGGEDDEDDFEIEYNIPPMSATVATVDTSVTGRVVAFPNLRLQHRVRGLRHSGASTQPARRQILAFFLVMDGEGDDEVLSTAKVPEQQVQLRLRRLRRVLQAVQDSAGGGRGMRERWPPEAERLIAEFLMRGSMTWDRAATHRLQLMTERVVRVEAETREFEREVNLCEH